MTSRAVRRARYWIGTFRLDLGRPPFRMSLYRVAIPRLQGPTWNRYDLFTHPLDNKLGVYVVLWRWCLSWVWSYGLRSRRPELDFSEQAVTHESLGRIEALVQAVEYHNCDNGGMILRESLQRYRDLTTEPEPAPLRKGKDTP